MACPAGAELQDAVEVGLRSVNLWNGGVGDKQAAQYSGGMKRRLSVAISFVGDPLVVYLDEPSTVRGVGGLGGWRGARGKGRLSGPNRAHVGAHVCRLAGLPLLGREGRGRWRLLGLVTLVSL